MIELFRILILLYLSLAVIGSDCVYIQSSILFICLQKHRVNVEASSVFNTYICGRVSLTPHRNPVLRFR